MPIKLLNKEIKALVNFEEGLLCQEIMLNKENDAFP